MKNILAIDTATKILSVSLLSNGVTYNTTIDEGFTHSENLLPSIDSLLKEAGIKIKNLELLICTRGPGSFTGLRIGISTLKGISTALDIPLISIPTLDLYAFKKNLDNGVVLPIIDARKKSFYTAKFKDGIKESNDLDLTLDGILELVKDDKNILLTGPDASILYEKVIDDERFNLDMNINNTFSCDLIELGKKDYIKNGPDDRDQGPLYIRKSEAEIHLLKKKSI